MNTYTWKINRMQTLPEHDGQEQVVYEIEWTCTVSNGTKSTSKNGTHRINYVADGFTPFLDLSEEQVVSWLFLNGVDESETKKEMDRLLESVIVGAGVCTPSPWVPVDYNVDDLPPPIGNPA